MRLALVDAGDLAIEDANFIEYMAENSNFEHSESASLWNQWACL